MNKSPTDGRFASIHSDEVVRRARLIHSRGYTCDETRKHLADEGFEVNREQLRKWLKWQTRIEAGGIDPIYKEIEA